MASAVLSSLDVFANWPSVANRTIPRLTLLSAIREVGALVAPHLVHNSAVHAHLEVLAIVWVFKDVDTLSAATISWFHRLRSLALTLGMVWTPTNWPFSTRHSVIVVALNQIRVVKPIRNSIFAIVCIGSFSAFAVYVLVTVILVREESPRAGTPPICRRFAGVAGVRDRWFWS